MRKDARFLLTAVVGTVFWIASSPPMRGSG
jgi:hypothetical protein